MIPRLLGVAIVVATCMSTTSAWARRHRNKPFCPRPAPAEVELSAEESARFTACRVRLAGVVLLGTGGVLGLNALAWGVIASESAAPKCTPQGPCGQNPSAAFRNVAIGYGAASAATLLVGAILLPLGQSWMVRANAPPENVSVGAGPPGAQGASVQWHF